MSRLKSTYEIVIHSKISNIEARSSVTKIQPDSETMKSYCIILYFFATVYQLSAAPHLARRDDLDAQINSAVNTGRDYGNSAMDTMSSTAQQAENTAKDYGNYALNQAEQDGRYVADQTQQYGQYAVDQAQQKGNYLADQTQQYGQYALDKGQQYGQYVTNPNSSSSLNPLSYFSSWWQEDPNYVPMIKRGIEQAKDLTQRGIQTGADSIRSLNEYQKSLLSRLSSDAQYGMQKLSENFDSMNGYIAERLYKTADSMGNISIPNLSQQWL